MTPDEAHRLDCWNRFLAARQALRQGNRRLAVELAQRVEAMAGRKVAEEAMREVVQSARRQEGKR